MYGLVLCGGESTRMGIDKSLLNYHGEPQCYHVYHRLEYFCKRVFISCNQKQEHTIQDDYEKITDEVEFQNKGPLTGILSAHKSVFQASLVVVACDYPLLIDSDIKLLVSAFDIYDKSVVFKNSITGFIEPLISIIHLRDLIELKNHFEIYHTSLKIFLQQSDAIILEHPNPVRLSSVDTQDDYELILSHLKILE